WMTQVATSWLIYRVTNSAWLLGFVGFSGQLPAFFLAPFAGVWIDRWHRLSILKISQLLSMIQSFALVAVVFTNHTTVWNIALLTMFQGIVNAFDMPARQSFIVEMIQDRADLANAIALNSSMVNGSRLIGPSIAGFVIAFAGWSESIWFAVFDPPAGIRQHGVAWRSTHIGLPDRSFGAGRSHERDFIGDAQDDRRFRKNDRDNGFHLRRRIDRLRFVAFVVA